MEVLFDYLEELSEDTGETIEWVACACNDDRVTVTDTAGFVLAVRG